MRQASARPWTMRSALRSPAPRQHSASPHPVPMVRRASRPPRRQAALLQPTLRMEPPRREPPTRTHEAPRRHTRPRPRHLPTLPSPHRPDTRLPPPVVTHPRPHHPTRTRRHRRPRQLETCASHLQRQQARQSRLRTPKKYDITPSADTSRTVCPRIPPTRLVSSRVSRFREVV